MDKNAEMARRQSTALTPNYLPQPISLDRGEGCRLYDAEGRSYLDMMGGIATVVLGHCHPRVVAALEDQAQKLWHASNHFTSGPQVALAERLNELCFSEQAYFCNSGTEANEAALKLARRYARDRGEDRHEILAFEGGFHGRTLFALSATGTPAYHEGFGPMVPGFSHAPYGDIGAARDLLSDSTAAIIVEPAQGENGVRPAPAGFLEGLRELANENGCLLIFDEIQTGMGRMGPLFAHQATGVEPDLMTLAKALGNGIPIGALLAKNKFARCFVPGSHGSTFGGNPLAAAAALAVLDELTSGGVLEAAADVAEYLGRSLQEMVERLGAERVIEIRGSGHLWGLELTRPVAEVITHCREAGVLTIPAGATVLRLAPALIITRAEIDEGLARIEAAIAADPI
jgi:acetylornithine/N-succinyldiaminopimelate aminotransferase